jgi:hypothetical protein
VAILGVLALTAGKEGKSYSTASWPAPLFMIAEACSTKIHITGSWQYLDKHVPSCEVCCIVDQPNSHVTGSICYFYLTVQYFKEVQKPVSWGLGSTSLHFVVKGFLHITVASTFFSEPHVNPSNMNLPNINWEFWVLMARKTENWLFMVQ